MIEKLILKIASEFEEEAPRGMRGEDLARFMRRMRGIDSDVEKVKSKTKSQVLWEGPDTEVSQRSFVPSVKAPSVRSVAPSFVPPSSFPATEPGSSRPESSGMTSSEYERHMETPEYYDDPESESPLVGSEGPPSSEAVSERPEESWERENREEREKAAMEVQSLMDMIDPEDRILLSPKKLDKVEVPSQYPEAKPKGIWYACGTEWLDWLKYEMPEWLFRYNFVYVVKPNARGLLRIRNMKALEEFNDEFGVDIDVSYYMNKYTREEYQKMMDEGGIGKRMAMGDLIDWPKVASKYSGIEICPYQADARMKYHWYNGWDIASGCIWDPSGMNSATLVAYRDEDDQWTPVIERRQKAPKRKAPKVKPEVLTIAELIRKQLEKKEK